MSRAGFAYQYDKGKWIATIRRSCGKVLIVTIPKGVVEDLKLRPGMKCCFRVETETEEASKE